MTHDLFNTNFFRYPSVVLVNLVLEDHLAKLCSALRRIKGNAKPPPTPKGDIIRSHKAYIDNFQLSYDKSLWQFTHDLSPVRNCIVHASGDVSRCSAGRRAALRGIASKDIGVNIGSATTHYELTPLYLDDDMLVIEPRFCESIIKHTADFLEALYKAANLPLELHVKRHTN